MNRLTPFSSVDNGVRPDRSCSTRAIPCAKIVLIVTDACQFANLTSQDPAIFPLADNGGPTWTHGLRQRSPALNAGRMTNAPPIDQRGVARPDGAGYDIGAFEGALPSEALYLPVLIKD